MPRGAGTLLNVVTVLLGSGIGLLLGQRLPERTRDVVTDGLGLVTLLVAALSAVAVTDPILADAVGSGGPVLVVLGSVLLGGIVGSLLRLEDRLAGLGDLVRRTLSRRVRATSRAARGRHLDRPDRSAGSATVEVPAVGGAASGIDEDAAGRGRFVDGFVTASLVFCVGPLTVLGSLDDGLGHGIDKLALKSTLDGFASIAFAASLGWGVAASALVVLVVQGTLTLLGALLGDLLPPAELSALTATGGLLLVGVGLRLLRIRPVPVADLLPALVVAPVLVAVVAALR